METDDENNNEKPLKNKINRDVEFENADVDPGFKGHQEDESLTSREDEREHDIDSNKSIKEMREEKKDEENDALNYKNDRDHGAFNPKNI